MFQPNTIRKKTPTKSLLEKKSDKMMALEGEGCASPRMVSQKPNFVRDTGKRSILWEIFEINLTM